MSDEIPYDEFNALLECRLDPAAIARLRARLDADPALRAEFDAYRDAHAFTAPLVASATVGSTPVSSLTIDRVDAARRAGRLRRLRPWVLVAATLLVAVGAAAYVRSQQPHVVTLRAIRLDEMAAYAPAASIPAALATYRPVVDGRLNWMTSLDEARVVAKATDRPLLVWVHHQQCPMCIELDREAMRDASLVAEAGKFVPVKLDVMKAPREVQAWCEAGWPYFRVQTADGAKVDEIVSEMDAAKIRDDLARHEADAASALPWDETNDLAKAYVEAESARVAGKYGDALRGYDEVMRRAGARRSEVSAGAASRRADIAREAHDVLNEAKKLAASDDPDGKRAGARRLSDAVERFHGTPYGLDLAEVEQELRATGRFPVLIEGR